MFFCPRQLSILTTRQCTAACDHCCIGSSPRATQAIPVERIRRLIEEATRVPSIELIGFTGGECFLLGKALDELVGLASSYGFRTRVITNAYWAVNDSAARKRVAGLRAQGLGEMMISTGTFHQRFVSVTQVAAAARAAAEAGILTRVAIETCDQSTFDDAWLLQELADWIDTRRIVIGYDPWTTDPGGRGVAQLSHTRLLDEQPHRAGGRCGQILNVISVTPAQELIACCGFPQEHVERLRLGSVADRSLDEVLAASPPELLKMWLHTDGPSAIARFVASHVPGYQPPSSPSICEICVTLQRDEVAMRVIAQHAGEVVQEVATRFAALQAAPA